jgi:hypothetical protein
VWIHRNIRITLRKPKRKKKIVLASTSGAHIEKIHEKNRGQKISRYCPFVCVLQCFLI